MATVLPKLGWSRALLFPADGETQVDLASVIVWYRFSSRRWWRSPKQWRALPVSRLRIEVRNNWKDNIVVKSKITLPSQLDVWFVHSGKRKKLWEATLRLSGLKDGEDSRERSRLIVGNVSGLQAADAEMRVTLSASLPGAQPVRCRIVALHCDMGNADNADDEDD